MGVRGAAVATVSGQILSGVLALIFHYRLDVEVDKSPRYWRPSGEVIREIYAIGLPAIVAQALTTVMTYGMNRILPVAWAFVRVMNSGGADSLVWWTFLIGETATLACAIILYYATLKRKIERLGVEPS